MQQSTIIWKFQCSRTGQVLISPAPVYIYLNNPLAHYSTVLFGGIHWHVCCINSSWLYHLRVCIVQNSKLTYVFALQSAALVLLPKLYCPCLGKVLYYMHVKVKYCGCSGKVNSNFSGWPFSGTWKPKFQHWPRIACFRNSYQNTDKKMIIKLMWDTK